MYLTWNVPWAEGTISAEAYDENNRLIPERSTEGNASVTTTGKAAKLKADADRKTITADGKDQLQEFLDVPLKNYSSGMVARLAFAVATITKPDILIADEILSVGDFLFQEKCEKRMAELLSGGTTVILVSHSIDQIERMCNKVAWLDHGHLRRIGATKEITAEYRRFEKKDAMPAKVTEE